MAPRRLTGVSPCQIAPCGVVHLSLSMVAYMYSNFDFPTKERLLEEIEVIVEIMQRGAAARANSG